MKRKFNRLAPNPDFTPKELEAIEQKLFERMCNPSKYMLFRPETSNTEKNLNEKF